MNHPLALPIELTCPACGQVVSVRPDLAPAVKFCSECGFRRTLQTDVKWCEAAPNDVGIAGYVIVRHEWHGPEVAK